MKAAHESLTKRLADGSIWDCSPVEQDKSLELRYTRNQDFTDSVAEEYLGRLLSPAEIQTRLAARDLCKFLDPYIPDA